MTMGYILGHKAVCVAMATVRSQKLRVSSGEGVVR